MPRPMGGSPNRRSSAGHSYSSRSSSGHRMNTSPTMRPGSVQRSQDGNLFSQQKRSNPNQNIPYWDQSPYPNQTPYRTPRQSSLFPFLLGGMLGSMNTRRRRTTNPYGSPIPPGMDPNVPYDRYGRPSRRSGSAFGIITVVFIVLLCLFAFSCAGCSSSSQSNDIPQSSYNRTKIQSDVPFTADCIVDEEGFFENPSKTGQRLKTFYDKTGIQPYLVIHSYDPALKTDAQKAEYAKDYYDQNIGNEDTFLYMYFAEPNDNAVGYMQTVNGKKVDTVMDAQAVDIFWNYIDNEWTSSKSTDDLFVDVFTQTADRIMTKTTTSNDVAMRGLLIAAIVIIAGAILVVIYLKNKREKEKAEETARILATPLKTKDPGDEDLVDRYTK